MDTASLGKEEAMIRSSASVNAKDGGGRMILWLFIAASALFLLYLKIFWVGYLGSDDVSYWEGATGWLHNFPYLGRDHWTLRHTLVIPIAVSRLLIGDSSTSLALPTVLYAEGLIAITGLWVWRSAGPMAAAIALLFLATYPQVIIYSSTADIDVIEIFLVFAAFFLIGSVTTNVSTRNSSSNAIGTSDCSKLFFAGILLGLALLSRETSVFAVIAVAIMCLAQYGFARKYYLLIFAGFAAVIAGEILYLWSQSGHFLYRYSLDAHHDSNIDRWKDQGAAIPFVHPAIDPFTMLLFNHNFGLVSWIAVPLSIWLFLRKDLENNERTIVILLGTLALVWAASSALLWTLLVLIPRYYMLPAVCVLVLAAMALRRMWRDGKRRLACILGFLLIFSNTAALALDSRNTMVGEYKLVQLASNQGRLIHTDPQTFRRAELLLQWAGVSERATAAPYRTGDLVFINPLRSRSNSSPPADWKLIDEAPVPLGGGQLIACSLPKQIVPKSMLGFVGCHRSVMRLYQVGGTL